MDSEQAISAFAALAQPTRLDVFRLLMEHEPDGLPAGEIARQMNVPHNTMSTHLAILTRAGLIEAERQSRSIIYRARLDAVRALTGFLVKDCCGGRPEICAPLIADLSPCCPPQEIAAKEAAHD
jgi:ArsR family transcriptional regulator